MAFQSAPTPAAMTPTQLGASLTNAPMTVTESSVSSANLTNVSLMPQMYAAGMTSNSANSAIYTPPTNVSMTSGSSNSRIYTFPTGVYEAAPIQPPLIVTQTPATSPIFYATRTTTAQAAYFPAGTYPLVNQAFSSYVASASSKSVGYAG